jgi:hypothetical protein
MGNTVIQDSSLFGVSNKREPCLKRFLCWFQIFEVPYLVFNPEPAVVEA